MAYSNVKDTKVYQKSFQLATFPNVATQSADETLITSLFQLTNVLSTLASTYPNDPDIAAAYAAIQLAIDTIFLEMSKRKIPHL